MRSKQSNNSVEKELAVLLIIRCLSVLRGGSCLQNKTSVWNKHWIIKKVRVSVCLQFVLFSQPQIWAVQYKQESHVFPTWPDRLKVKNSRRPELINPASPPPPASLAGNLMPVPLSCLPGIQQLKQVSSRFKVGSGPRSCALTRLHVLFFFNAHDSKASAATCFGWPSSHTALVYTSAQQKHNISWAGDKDTPRRRQWGEVQFRAV